MLYDIIHGAELLFTIDALDEEDAIRRALETIELDAEEHDGELDKMLDNL